MQGSMKAARFYGARGPQGKQEVVRVEETPIPDIDRNEVLIRVLRAGLNHGDLHMREDGINYVMSMPYPIYP
jgi:NADPH:quinone reductase-like Zn-dependent oxidoreductase